MKHLVAIPTWIITRLLAPFLSKKHPWYGRRFTLEDWAIHETPLCRMFDFTLWFWLPATVAGLFWLMTRQT